MNLLLDTDALIWFGENDQQIEESDAVILGILPEHTLLIERLPLHHGDPFDRMLIAQASVEGLTIVTRDPHFPDYGVEILW